MRVELEITTDAGRKGWSYTRWEESTQLVDVVYQVSETIVALFELERLEEVVEASHVAGVLDWVDSDELL